MGIVLCLRNDRVKEVAPLVLLIIYIVAVSMPILAQARYSEPLNPFLSILACIPFVPARRRFNSAKLHEAPTPFIDETRSKLVRIGASAWESAQSPDSGAAERPGRASGSNTFGASASSNPVGAKYSTNT
jgi:hypothetical protein